MFRKIVRTTIEAACRALLKVEKVMARWMAPEPTPGKVEKYRVL